MRNRRDETNLEYLKRMHRVCIENAKKHRGKPRYWYYTWSAEECRKDYKAAVERGKARVESRCRST